MINTRDEACRVLIVDNDRSHIEIITVSLGGLRFNLYTDYALTIDEAVASISFQTPDIVFLDNRIPPDSDFRNGFENIRRAGYSGPVIVNSVTVDDPTLRDAIALGVSRVVNKFDLREETLRELISTYWHDLPPRHSDHGQYVTASQMG